MVFKDNKWTNLSGFCSRCIMSPWEVDGRIPQSWHFRNSQVLIRASSRSVSGRSSILLVRSGISRVPEQFGDKVLLHQYTAACYLTYAIVFCDRALFPGVGGLLLTVIDVTCRERKTLHRSAVCKGWSADTSTGTKRTER